MILIFTICLIMQIFIVNKYEREKTYKYFYLMMILGFTFYSGIGIITEYKYIEENAFMYLIQFELFILLFILGSILVRKYRFINISSNIDIIFQSKFINFMVTLYIFTYIYRCIFSGVTIYDFCNIKYLFINYRSTPFAIRVLRNNSTIYKFITSQVATIAEPFYYIYLYNNRKKHGKFLFIYILPIILLLVADGYLSRNRIAVYFVFIYIYLIKEKIIPKKIGINLALFMIPISLFIFSFLESIRLGNIYNYEFLSSIKKLLLSESSYPIYYDYCLNKSKEISTLNYLIYIFIVWIPSQFYKIVGFNIPNLAYSFTEAVLGLSFGETSDYYIVLPSVLGEAIMVFGKYFAFIYGGIYGIFSTWFLKILKSHKSLYYLMIYYLLDFFRQFRGGSQYVISLWEAMLVPMIFIILLLSSILRANKVR